ncbi:MAG TPA: YeeE/YedE family protein [Firmicutes bacterium]|jgi:hypothetical protein|nr:YeeE/YedE family protein [Bacillota bacterium]HBT17629.1 YeeE/YedE family protein [Bacillota bacterium]
MKLEENKYFKAVVKDAWPYTLGAVLLALLNITLFISNGSPWGVTTPFLYWATWIYKAFGGQVENWVYFNNPAHLKAINLSFLTHGGSLMNIGIIFGAFIASLAASQFKIRKIKSIRQVIVAISGGLLMGYGTRIAFGCNIGAFFSGVASFSLHGWVYTIFIFVGAWIGSKLLVKFFM